MAEGSRIPRQIVDLQRQVVEFQKAAFENTFNALAALQDQQQEFVSRLLEQSSRVPDEFKEIVEGWSEALRSGRDQFRDTVDHSFSTVEKYLERVAGEVGDEGEQGGDTKEASS